MIGCDTDSGYYWLYYWAALVEAILGCITVIMNTWVWEDLFGLGQYDMFRLIFHVLQMNWSSIFIVSMVLKHYNILSWGLINYTFDYAVLVDIIKSALMLSTAFSNAYYLFILSGELYYY